MRNNLATQGSAILAPKISSELQYLEERLNTTLVNLTDAVTALEQRLVPITRNEPESASGNINPRDERPVHSDFGRELLDKVNRIEGLEMRVERLLNVLAI